MIEEKILSLPKAAPKTGSRDEKSEPAKKSRTKMMIYLDREIHKKLKHLAVDEEISMSEIVRMAISKFFASLESADEKEV